MCMGIFVHGCVHLCRNRCGYLCVFCTCVGKFKKVYAWLAMCMGTWVLAISVHLHMHGSGYIRICLWVYMCVSVCESMCVHLYEHGYMCT